MNKFYVYLYVLVFLFISCSCSFSGDLSGIEKKLSKYPVIKHAALVEVIKQNNVFLIDANGSESFNRGHIPGAVDFSIGEEELKAQLPEDKERLIICYCGSPMCPSWYKAATFVSSLGYTNIKHYKKGLKGWIKAGETIEEGEN